ncbi:MAG: MFS transporter [Dehalococcoidales bacterium]|nr:MFS transporter [Dehalococcoidales bacterium]
MRLPNIFKPKPTISDQEVTSGLRWLTLEGSVSLGFNSITTSGFLAAYALALGANSLQIGILAALPFLMQILQLPAISLVEKFRQRKAMAVISWFIAQSFWIPISLIPKFMAVPSGTAISLLLALMAIRGLFHASTNAAWNGWVRDLVPQTILGRFFSRRLVFATITGVAFSLAAALFVDYWQNHAAAGSTVFGYTYVLLFGALCLGLLSPIFMSRMPEPLMQPATGPQVPLRQRVMAPLKDSNFKKLVQFLFSWNFALNLAVPFFAVYILQRLGMSLTWVIVLSITGQMFNILFLRVWGNFVDRFGNKVVLSICASLYLVVIGGWIFTTMPEKHFLTIPLLFVLHIFAGIANAGATLTVGTIGLKMAPKGEATSYLAASSLATNLGAGLGPLVGGLMAIFFSTRQLNINVSWMAPASTSQFTIISISGYDFLFAISFIVGLITLSILARLKEEGEVSREVMLESLMFPTREFSRPMSSVPAFNLAANFPFGNLRRVPVGLDAVLGVTAYQIAEIGRVATMAAVRGRRVTKKINQSLQNGLSDIWKDKEAEVRVHGAEISRQVARGAVHIADDKSVDTGQVAAAVIAGVVKASTQAGADPLDAILGASQGVIQGTAEAHGDLATVTARTIETAKGLAVEAGVSETLIAVEAAQNALETAEAIGSEAVAQVTEGIPEIEVPGQDAIKG